MMESMAQDRELEDIDIGETVSFQQIVSEDAIAAFARLSGDLNPLHVDPAYAKGTPFGERVVYGMLLGAYVSRLVGMHLPGKRALIVKETLEFKKPVHVGDALIVKGTVVAKSQSVGMIEVSLEITVDGEVVTTGSVHSRVRSE